MKKSILLLALFVGLGNLAIAQNTIELSSDASPKIEFVKKSHDFGSVEHNVPANYTFTFKNTGNAPLILKNVKPSCSCTSPKWTREPIAPGAEGVIVVEYNAKTLGNFTKSVTVTHNGDSGTVYLSIRGTVTKSTPAPAPTVATTN